MAVVLLLMLRMLLLLMFLLAGGSGGGGGGGGGGDSGGGGDGGGGVLPAILTFTFCHLDSHKFVFSRLHNAVTCVTVGVNSQLEVVEVHTYPGAGHENVSISVSQLGTYIIAVLQIEIIHVYKDC